MKSCPTIVSAAVAAICLLAAGCVTEPYYPEPAPAYYTEPAVYEYYSAPYVNTVIVDPVLPPAAWHGGAWSRHDRRYADRHPSYRDNRSRPAPKVQPRPAEHRDTKLRPAAPEPAAPKPAAKPAAKPQSPANRPSLPKVEPRSRIQPRPAASKPAAPKSAPKPAAKPSAPKLNRR